MFIQRSQPIAEQVLNLLRQRIRDKYYNIDNRMPSENELAAELKVSRATIRSALAALTAEKWIVRYQGDGTYINRRFLDTTMHFGMISEYTSMISSSGQNPDILALHILDSVADYEVAAALEIEPETPVLKIVRLFLADSKPAIYSTNVIPAHLLSRPLTLPDIEEPLPSFFKKHCDQEFTYGLSKISAVTVNGEVAELLHVPDNAPMVCMHEVFYNTNDCPLVWAMNYFNDKVFNLRVARSFD
jgi:GntR family transcriptional regulator